MTQIAPPNWQVQRLRLTVFMEDPTKHDPDDWWMSVAGTEPDVSTVNRREEKSETYGPLGERILRLTIRPDRLDWLLTPGPDASVASTGIAKLGSLQEVMRECLAMFAPWLEGLDEPVVRLALGVHLMLSVPSKVVGYEKLMELTHLDIDPITSQDILYRINRPRSDIVLGEGLGINRLGTWTVVHTGGIRIAMAGDDRPTITQDEPTHEVVLELDINTATKPGYVLPHSSLSALFGELIDLGTEIAMKGDVP